MRFGLYPTPEQETLLLGHCGHARFVWDLAVEQLAWSRPGRWCPHFARQCRQLAQARREFGWLGEGSSIVRQQALREFNQAMVNWRGGTHRKPTWRKKDQHEGLRIVNPPKTEHLNRGWSRVFVAKVGWLKFGRARALAEAKS